MKNIVNPKMSFSFCIILFVCILYVVSINIRSPEQKFSEHGMFDVFQTSIRDVDMEKYMPKQTVDIKYDLSIRYSLTSLCWSGHVSKEAFETFIKQNLDARKLEEHIDFLFCDKLGVPIPQNIVVFTIGKAIIGYDYNKQIMYGQYTSK